MKKKLLLLLVAALAAYAVMGVVACCLMPKRIAEAERRVPGMEAALAKVAGDQKLAAQRMADVMAATLGRGRDKVAEVDALLADADLNHLALTYLGTDWSLQRSAFLGSVRHMRELLAMQKAERAGYVSRLNRKIEELERRKRQLARQLRSPSSERSWRVEMDDIERQLFMFRTSNTYREYMEKDRLAEQEVEAKAKNEEAIFQMAQEYQTKTVGVLMQVMAEQTAALRGAMDAVYRLRSRMAWFNIWPLNRLARMTLREE